MSYQPKVQETKFDESPHGMARIKVKTSKKGKPFLALKFNDEQDKKSQEWAGEIFSLLEWPDFLKKKQLKLLEGVTWFVKLGGKDNDKLFSISPSEGMHTGKFIGFSGKDGEEPTFKHKGNVQYPYDYFIALIEIVKDKNCRGMVIPYFLRYHFGEDDEGNTMFTKAGPGAFHTPKLQEFLQFTGAWKDGAIKWMDNILPELQERMLRADNTFKFVLKNGWIDNLYVDLTPTITEEPPWEDEKPKKKKKKDKVVEEEFPTEREEDLDWDD